MRTRVLLLFMVAAVGAGCASLSSHPPRATDLSGDWKLDQALSEDPRAVMRQQRQGGSGHGMHHGGGMGGGYGMPGGATPGTATSGTYGGGMHGGHHGGGAGGSGSGGSWAGGRHGPGSEFLVQPAALQIHQSPSQLKLVADGVPTEFEYGEKVTTSVQGGTAERVSGWKGQDFVVKYDVADGGPKATRSYELNDGGKQLVVITQVEGGHGPEIKLHTVYDRAPAG